MQLQERGPHSAAASDQEAPDNWVETPPPPPHSQLERFWKTKSHILLCCSLMLKQRLPVPSPRQRSRDRRGEGKAGEMVQGYQRDTVGVWSLWVEQPRS